MTMRPPTGGPSSGPMVDGICSQAIAFTSSDFELERSSTSRPTGTIIAPPIPWMMRAPTRKAEIRRLRAEDRAEREQADRGPEHDPRAETVGDLAARRNEDGEAEQVGGQRHVHVQRVGAERARHRGQRGGQHGAVELLHEHRAGDDQRDRPRAGGCRRGRDGVRRATWRRPRVARGGARRHPGSAEDRMARAARSCSEGGQKSTRSAWRRPPARAGAVVEQMAAGDRSDQLAKRAITET